MPQSEKRQRSPFLEGWLPLHAAAHLALEAEALAVILGAHPPAAAMPDVFGHYPLHLAASGGADAPALSVVLEAHPAAAAAPDVRGQWPLHLG